MVESSSRVIKKYILGAVSLIISLAALFLSIFYNNSLKVEYKRLDDQLNYLYQRNMEFEEYLKIYTQYMPIFEQYQKNSFIGNTKRLQWFESVKSSTDLYQLPYLDYSFQDSQSVQGADDFYQHSSLQLDKTNMEIKFKLLHEGDFYNLLYQLHNAAHGLFSAEMCTLSRSAKADSTIGINTITGTCDLKWYSIKNVLDTSEGV